MIANGRLVSKKRSERGTTWRWRADEPMAPYLAFFAAGDFTIKKGTSDGLPWINAVSQQLSVSEQKSSLSCSAARRASSTPCPRTSGPIRSRSPVA